MVERLLSVNDEDMRLPAVVREQLAVELVDPGTEVGAGLSATYVPVIVYSGSAYPPRPAGSTSVKFIGPVVPTTWLPNDEWVDNS